PLRRASKRQCSAAEALIGNVVSDHGVFDRRRFGREQPSALGGAGGERVARDRAVDERQRPLTAVPDSPAYPGAGWAARGRAVAAEGGVADRQHRPEVAEAAALNMCGAGRSRCGEDVSAEHAVTDRDAEAVAPASSAGCGESAPARGVGADRVAGDAGIGDRLDPSRPDASGGGTGTGGRRWGHVCGDVVVANDAVGGGELTVVTNAATKSNGIADGVARRDAVAGDRAVPDFPGRTRIRTGTAVVAGDVDAG